MHGACGVLPSSHDVPSLSVRPSVRPSGDRLPPISGERGAAEGEAEREGREQNARPHSWRRRPRPPSCGRRPRGGRPAAGWKLSPHRSRPPSASSSSSRPAAARICSLFRPTQWQRRRVCASVRLRTEQLAGHRRADTATDSELCWLGWAGLRQKKRAKKKRYLPSPLRVVVAVIVVAVAVGSGVRVRPPSCSSVLRRLPPSSSDTTTATKTSSSVHPSSEFSEFSRTLLADPLLSELCPSCEAVLWIESSVRFEFGATAVRRTMCERREATTR